MDAVLDSWIKFAVMAAQVNVVQMLVLVALRFMATSARAQAGYETGVAWSALCAIFWLVSAALLLLADLAMSGNLP